MNIFRLVSYSASHICLMCFLLTFTKRRYSRKKTVTVAALTAAVLIFLEWIRYRYFEAGIRVSWPLVLQILAVQAAALYLSQYRDYRALFTGLTSSNYVLLGNLSARCLYSLGAHYLVCTAVGAVINLLFLAELSYFLRPVYMELQLINLAEWKGFCLIPSAYYLSLLILTYCLDGTKLSDNIAAMSLLITVYLTYVLVFRMIGELNEKNRIKKEQEVLNAGIKAQKRAAEEARMAEQRIAVQNHDRRHLIHTMRMLMADQDYAALDALLREQEEHTEAYAAPGHFCENVPVNGTVSYYEAAAGRQNIRFRPSIDIPEKLSVNEWELTVVISNLLENAVRAAAEVPDPGRREVEMTAKQIRGQMLIEIRNTYEGTVTFDEATGLPISKRGEGHGLGLQSVAYFAERSAGTFDCGVEDGWFFARLLL